MTSADETARLRRRAKSDSDANITYEPETRPEVANLLLLVALSENSSPDQGDREHAHGIGDVDHGGGVPARKRIPFRRSG